MKKNIVYIIVFLLIRISITSAESKDINNENSSKTLKKQLKNNTSAENNSITIAEQNKNDSFFSHIKFESFFGTHYTKYKAEFDVPLDASDFFVNHTNIMGGMNMYYTTSYLDYGIGASLSSNSLIDYNTGVNAILFPMKSEQSIVYFPVASVYLIARKDFKVLNNKFSFRTKFGKISSYAGTRHFNDHIAYDIPSIEINCSIPIICHGGSHTVDPQPAVGDTLTEEILDIHGKNFISFALGYQALSWLEVAPYINLSHYVIDAYLSTNLPLPPHTPLVPNPYPLSEKTTADTYTKEVGLMFIFRY